jgi:ABC-type lipoprotein export system ATPase subunit
VLAGVDAASEATILETLTAERRDGRAVVMATHDLQLARVVDGRAAPAPTPVRFQAPSQART